MIKHIIFDLDGTLVDSCGVCVDILSEMLVERGSDRVLDAATAVPFMSAGGVQMVSGLLGSDCGDPAVELADFRARYARRKTARSSLYPGVVDGLTELKAAGFTLSICSNKPQLLCDNVLVDTGLAPLFEAVVGGRPGLRPKPALDLLVETLTQLRARPEECVFVGDSDLDHAIAHAAAMPFLFMSYGYAPAEWSPIGVESFDTFDAMTASLLGTERVYRVPRAAAA